MGGPFGDAQAFVRRLAAADGQRVWGRQSIDTPYDSAVVARVGAGGEVVLGGAVVGDLGGQVSQGQADGFVQVVAWEDGAAGSTVLLGGPEDDFIEDLQIAAPGVYVVAGYTLGILDGRQGPQDGQRPDAFIAKIVTIPAAP
jgi:hypothetical protein